MEQFTPQTIGNLLLIIGALLIAGRGFVWWCKRVDGRPAYDPLRDGPHDTAKVYQIRPRQFHRYEPAAGVESEGGLP